MQRYIFKFLNLCNCIGEIISLRIEFDTATTDTVYVDIFLISNKFSFRGLNSLIIDTDMVMTKSVCYILVSRGDFIFRCSD